ncbi:interferon gamma 1 [Xyrichtys novacula]|uniref:Interferon gamma 1 n=1 Tax=Xyrichtys novacula TaxID=13765 RepID=A0AAV1F0Q7_XYRNO|nr:interferon gamma 1 [Xyrichtys novacula]
MAATAKAVVCLCLCLTACQVRGSFVPQEMNRTLKTLLNHYEIPPEVRYNGNLVFSREPLTGKVEVQKVYMAGVLETYEKLLGHMMKQPHTSSPVTAGGDVQQNAGTAVGAETELKKDIRKKLESIVTKVKDLREHQFQEQEKLLHRLQSLRHIKMDNLEVQSKALSELPWLYDSASNLANNSTRQRRRRRQAWKIKTHPKAKN